MTNLKHHGAFWLRDDAAKQFDRAEDERGKLRVSSAGRTVGEQQGLLNRWATGGKYNRPPYLYQPKSPASASDHVVNGGEAIDTPDFEKFNDYCHLYGFKQMFPVGDPVHFKFFATVVIVKPTGNITAIGFSQDVLNQQAWLNAHRGEKLVQDGLYGNATRDAYKRYQTYLKASWGDTGNIDGSWGPATQASHQRWADSMVAPAPTAVNYPNVNVVNVTAIGDVRGLQKIARQNGGKTTPDNKWGPESQRGFQVFLNRNYGGSVANWLRKRWGYVGNDQLGPQMIAALQRANAENFRVL